METLSKLHLVLAQIQCFNNLIFISLRFIDFGMSTPAPPAEAVPAKLNKVELFSDVLASASIVAAFLFLSFSHQYNLWETYFPFTLSSPNDIAFVYLLYSLLIFILKIAAVAIGWKAPTDLSNELQAAVGRSLFAVTSIIAIHILLASAGEGGESIRNLSQISIWLLVAELNIIFCGLLRKVPAFASLAFFGWTIEAILVLGLFAKWGFAFDFFEVL